MVYFVVERASFMTWQLHRANNCTCSLPYTHTWPFQPETKVLGVQGTCLVTTFLTGGGEVGAQGNVSLYIIAMWELIVSEHTPYTSMFPGVKHWLPWLMGISCHLKCWCGDGSLFKVVKCVKDLVIFIKGQEGVYSSLSDDSNNLHLSFQLRESTL